MSKSNNNASHPEVHDDVIELGAVSTVTKGIGINTEPGGPGLPVTPGISEE